MSTFPHIRRLFLAATTGAFTAYSINNPSETKLHISRVFSFLPIPFQHLCQHALLSRDFPVFYPRLQSPQDVLDIYAHSASIRTPFSLAALVYSGELASWLHLSDSGEAASPRTALYASLVLLKLREPHIYEVFLNQLRQVAQIASFRGEFRASEHSDRFLALLRDQGADVDEVRTLEKVGLVPGNFSTRKFLTDKLLWTGLFAAFLVI